MIDRIRARSAGIVAGLLLSTLAVSAPAQEKFASKWFRYGPGVDSAWTISADPAKPLQLSVQRKARASSASSKRVLVLYPRPSSAYDIAITKILQEFDAKDVDATVTVINFEMNDVRGTESIQFAENNKIDLIFAMGSESTAWLFDNYRGGKIPVVSVCSKDPVQLGQIKDYERGSGSNFAFTSLNVPVEVQMAYVKELRPDLKNLAVLVDRRM